jgi:hypothetical protein
MNIRHYEVVAERKLCVPAGWVWFRYESLDPDITKLTGCVSSGVKTKGKHKGRPRYDGARREAYITDAEATLEFQRYEREEGKCGECMGSGKTFASWHYLTGTTYRDCRKCHGSGQAHEASQETGARERGPMREKEQSNCDV